MLYLQKLVVEAAVVLMIYDKTEYAYGFWIFLKIIMQKHNK